MKEVRKRYETVNDNHWSLETRMDTMIRDQEESSCAIQSKLEALLRNSISQDKAVPEKTAKQPGTSVEIAEPHRQKQEFTLLPPIHHIIESEPVNSATRRNTSNWTKVPKKSNFHASMVLDAKTWANPWELMSKTLEAFSMRTTESIERGGDTSRKTLMKSEEFKDDSDGSIDTWVEVMKLYKLYHLNDESQACTMIVSNLEITS